MYWRFIVVERGIGSSAMEVVMGGSSVSDGCEVGVSGAVIVVDYGCCCGRVVVEVGYRCYSQRVLKNCGLV